MSWFCVILASIQLNSTIQEIFTEEYFHPLQVEANDAKPILALQRLIEDYRIASIVVAGCGKDPWIPSSCRYIGIDIVEEIVVANGRNERGTFRLADMTEEVFPRSDLILCRNIFDFFSYRDIASSLEKFKESQSVYLIANTFPKLEKNQETATGIRRMVNLQCFPFFPEPLSLIKDSSEEGGYLGIWRLEDIDVSRFEKQAFPPVTFLTKPVGYGVSESHWGVANSVIRGLKRVCRDYNVNPDHVADVLENIVITGNHHAAVQAYEWKKQDAIKTLLLGPNFAPSTENFIIAWPLVDCYLGNSEWYETNLMRINPSLKGRICRWYAGIDETYWKPATKFKDKKSNTVLLYHKSGDLDSYIEKTLRENGYTVILIAYGRYTHEHFKQLLQECKFAVFVSISETQGLALAESWSMDVPVLALNRRAPHDWDGYTWTNTSSCPYMNPMVGIDWVESDDFRKIVQSFDEISATFQPRRWVLLNMTDKISVEKLMSNIRFRGGSRATH